MRRVGVLKTSRTGLALALVLGWLALPLQGAQALVGDSEGAFGLNGSIRTLFFGLDQDGTFPFSGKNEIDALSQTILRLTVMGRPTKDLSYEVHWVQTFTASSQDLTGGGQNFASGAASAPRFRVFDASWNLLEDKAATSSAFFDRFNVKWAAKWCDVTTGRQAITFGKAYFWNPLDVFFPFDASQFDRDYKPGVDAVRVDVPFGSFSGMNLVGAAGSQVEIGNTTGGGSDPSDASWYGSALLARFFTDISGWDVAVQGGKIFGGWQAGAGIVGDLGPVQLRGEMAQFWAMPSDPLPFPLKGDLVESHFLGVVGMGHRFENSFSLDLEYFFNGAGDPGHLNEALARTQFGSSLQLSRHLLGVLARYEFTPLSVGQLAMINSLSDGSTQLQPIVTVSLSDEMDLLMGFILNIGPASRDLQGGVPEVRSEFGTPPNILFVEWKYYF